MATAEKSQDQSIWSDLPIEVICGTGEFESGKTVFGVSIDPDGKTLVMDNEGSSTIYRRDFAFEHIDMAAELQKKYGDKYTPVQRYLWWKRAAIARGKSGQFRVLMVDPFSEIEDGIAQYVEQHPDEFGYTTAQFRQSSGLKWGCIKSALKRDLDLLRTYYQTIYLVVHMRNEFGAGGRPTGKREPKGKETLFELASLYLQFERPKGQRIPSAVVLKSRLAIAKRDESGKVARDEFGDPILQPLLPPRIPKATPGAIRRYIANPPDFDNLSEDEQYHEKPLSEDDRLRMQLAISENEADAKQAELSAIEKAQRAAAAQAAVLNAQPQPTSLAADVVAAKQEKMAAEATATASAFELKQLMDAAKASGIAPSEFGRRLREEYQVGHPRELSPGQAQAFTSALLMLKHDAGMQAAADKLAASGTASTVDCDADPTEPVAPAQSVPSAEGVSSGQPAEQPAPTATTEPSQPQDSGTQDTGSVGSPELCTMERAKEIVALFSEARVMPAKVREILGKYGVSKISEMTAADAENLAEKLKTKIAGQPDTSATDQLSPEQHERIQSLALRVGWPHAKQTEYLVDLGINSFRSMTREQADVLIDKLLKTELGFTKKDPSPVGG